MGKTKWQYQLDFSSFYHNDNISIIEKGKMVAKKIRTLPCDTIDYYLGDDFEELACYFDDIGGLDIDHTEEFDDIMSQLYDMADRYYVWIETK